MEKLGFYRDIWRSFSLEGKAVELIAKAGDKVIGGLVANWTDDNEVEIRHITIIEAFHRIRVGQKLVKCLISMTLKEDCHSINIVARQSSVKFFEKLGLGYPLPNTCSIRSL